MENTFPKVRKIFFEVTNRCNLSCRFCPIRVSRRKKEDMDFDLFKKGIDEISDEGIVDTVGFHVLGEPLMYPRIFDAVAYAAEAGLKTELHTNGVLLNHERIARLSEAGLSDIVISLQFAGEEGHALCRGALPLEAYYQRVLESAGAFRRKGVDVTVCYMNTASKRFFTLDGADMKGWDQSPADEAARRVLRDLTEVVDGLAEEDDIMAVLRKVNPLQPVNVRIDPKTVLFMQPFADWGNAFTGKKVFPARIGTCEYGLKNIGVLSSGEVTICCADYDGHTSLGNLRQGSFREFLGSEQVRGIERGFRHFILEEPWCRRCLGAGSPAGAFLKGLLSIYLFSIHGFKPSGEIREITLKQREAVML
ncbi:MAG: radical SAM protein [Spirochaetales bacterium]|nr:radical SAM protein [Spirochaetales bacterium]